MPNFQLRVGSTRDYFTAAGGIYDRQNGT